MSGPPADRRRQLLAIVAFGVALAAVLIVISQLGKDSPASPEEAGSSTSELLGSLPRNGTELGESSSPVTLTEFGDPQCPFCGRFAREVVPDIVERYVDPGDLKVDFQALTFIGPDSERAARVAAALIPEGRYWDMIDLLYQSQGTENTGYVTTAYLTDLLEQIPGVDPEKVLQESTSPKAGRVLERAKQRAEKLGVNSTPTLFISVGNGKPKQLTADPLDKQAVLDEIGSYVEQG